MTAFESMEAALGRNVGRVASAIGDFDGRGFAEYDPEGRVLRIGKEWDDCWSYYSYITSVVRMTEGKDGRIDALFESYRSVDACGGAPVRMRTYGGRLWYQGSTACRRALKDAAEFLGVPLRRLQDACEEARR